MKNNHSAKGLAALLTICAIITACNGVPQKAEQAAQDAPATETAEVGTSPANGAPASETDPVAAAAEKAMEAAENQLDNKAKSSTVDIQKSAN
jgi:hypothetical protein